MKLSQILLIITLSAVTAFTVGKYVPSSTPSTKETAFERVMRTGTLRCAYVIGSPPRFIYDAKSTKPKGFLVEIMDAVGKQLNLKVKWEEQTTYGLFTENLHSGRQDAFCGIVWRSAARAHKVLLTAPLYFTAVHAYVNEKDTRFSSVAELNNENVTFSLLDGSSMEAIAVSSFPKAKRHLLPLNSGATDSLMDVASKKADAALYDQITIDNYNNGNPDKKLKRVGAEKPVRLYGESYAVNMGEWKLREMLDTAIGELQTNGTIDRILKKHKVDETLLPRSRNPYAPIEK